jgi:hypothetical protein
MSTRSRHRWLVPVQGALIALTLVGAVTFVELNRSGVVRLSGSALQDGGAKYGFGRPVPPGAQWLLWDFGLENVSSSPLTVESISLPGPGMGDVVDIVRIELESADSPLVVASMYGFHPPATGCKVARVGPVSGRELQPGDEARIAVWLHAVRPGNYRYEGYEVHYRQNGMSYEQTVHVGQRGRVAPDGSTPDLGGVSPCARELVTPLADLTLDP